MSYLTCDDGMMMRVKKRLKSSYNLEMWIYFNVYKYQILFLKQLIQNGYVEVNTIYEKKSK